MGRALAVLGVLVCFLFFMLVSKAKPERLNDPCVFRSHCAHQWIELNGERQWRIVCDPNREWPG